MRQLFLLTAVLLGLSLPAPAGETDGWIKLFNGKDLSGWRIYINPNEKADPKEVFKVEDGVINCAGNVYGYLITDKDYSDYVLKVQWRWGEKIAKGRNSGVFVHVVGPDKIWPKGVEAQLAAGRAGDIWLVDGFMLKVDEARRDPKVARHFYRTKDKVERPLGEWNQYEITCRGNTIKLVVNGTPVNEGTDAELTRGKILLQSEGAQIYFRDVMLKPLAK